MAFVFGLLPAPPKAPCYRFPVPEIRDLTIFEMPAHGGSQTAANRTRMDIDTIVMHTSEGKQSPAYGPAHWFADKRAPASAHYSVYADGRIYRSVPDRDIAWHAGNSAVNRRSLGIEIQAKGDEANWTEVQLFQAARLVAALSKTYQIPIDRQHIVGHVEVSGPGGHTDPGPHWPWDRFLGLVKQVSKGTVSEAAAAAKIAPLGIPVWGWALGLGTIALIAFARLGRRDNIW